MTAIVLRGATLIDGTGNPPRKNSSVLVENGLIKTVGAVDSLSIPNSSTVIDIDGMTLLPGLTDAHVHFGILGINHRHTIGPEDNLTSYVIDVTENIELALQEGFTTVRDAGGLDPAFAHAVEKRLINGPRILPSGSPLSQTGGHGDVRQRYESILPTSIPGILATMEICDGADQVRFMARRQLRSGATQIKVMGSGGVMSPTDKLESVQFTVEEISAAVNVAKAAGTYVMAHCHTPDSINNCLEAGVKSIEHGSILDEPTSARMVHLGAYLVPTLAVIESLVRNSAGQGVTPENMAKLGPIRHQMPISVKLAADSGVNMGSGSDLLGKHQTNRGEELSLKSKILGPMEAILSATSGNAKLFDMDDKIGSVSEGMLADIVVVKGDPLTNQDLFTDPDNIQIVMKNGRLEKYTL